MPRCLSPEELQKRGAKRADGQPYSPPTPKVDATPVPETVPTPPASVVVEAPTIDTEPIAAVLREALAALARHEVPTVSAEPAKASAPEAWEFTIERDHMGKLIKVRAVAVAA